MWHILIDQPHWAPLKRRLLLAGIPLALVLLLVVAWGLDARTHAGEPLRGVEVAGRAVGGLSRSRLHDAVTDIAGDYADAKITIHTGDGDIETTAGDVGLTVDVDATARAAVDEGRDTFVALRPVEWATGLFGAREAGVVATVDRAKVRSLVSAEDPTSRKEPREPGITGKDGGIAVVLGEPGHGLDADEVAHALEDAIASGRRPIAVDAEPHEIAPRFTRADAEALVDKAKKLTSSPLAVTAGSVQAEIPASTIRTWLRSKAGDDHLELTLDRDDTLDGLATLLAGARVEPEDARFTVQGNTPVILEGVVGKTCCDEKAVGYLLGAVKAGLSADDDAPVDLPLREAEPDRTTEELEKLGIVEEIGSFTTHHKCCENRVQNIHRIADLVRGVVIDPGERFSVNDFVGKRTTENGFVSDHAIENGSFVEAVGGGISQFATTTFNAAFFAGLDLVEYQSHSIYISRYPYGREATLSYPKPDLVIGNSTPYGVLIWTSYTDTSLTVTLYSTRYAHGEQTAQSEAPVGSAGCKRVTTTRTRTYVDGHTDTDKVYAVYRPAEGVQCNGSAPPATTTTTTTQPAASPSTTAGG
jgi:vancomycin resistance protein YoaR